MNRNMTLKLDAQDAKALHQIKLDARLPTWSAAVRHAVRQHAGLIDRAELAEAQRDRARQELAELSAQASRLLDAQDAIRQLVSNGFDVGEES